VKPSSRILDAGERTTRAACSELDAGLRAGACAGAEAVFAKYPSLCGNAEAAVEVVFTEYLTREAMGRPNDPAGYYERFPQWRDRLERLFQVDELLKDDIAPDGESGPVAGTGTTARIVGDSRRFIPAAGAPFANGVAGYQLLEKLGSGGMGVVFKAVQPGLKRLVALKLLRHGSEASAAVLVRFRREAELTARFRHPNIVPVYDVGEANGEPYLAMEYVTGGTLRDRLQNKILPAADAARLVEKLARAVEYAHGQNVVHRDLKPGNILLDGPETGSGTEAPTLHDSRTNTPTPPPELSPKITDFGLAVGRDQSSGLTRQGQILGTPSYMAPEQAIGKTDEAGPAVDIYALGAILYECVTGRPPFLAETELETLRQVTEQDPPPPRELQPNVPRDLETVCLKCLHKDPAKRYPTAGALADDLARFRIGDAILARPSGTAERVVKWARRHPTASFTAGVGLLAVVAGLVLWAQYAAHLKIARDGADLDASRARSAARVADEERVKAERLAGQLTESLASEARQRHQARAVLDRVLGAVIDEWFVKLPSLTVVQKDLLNRILADYEALTADSPTDEAGRLGLARATLRVAYMRLILGSFTDAEAAYRRAKDLLHPYRDRPDVRLEYAMLLNELGTVYERASRYADAVAARREALTSYEAARAAEPGHRDAEGGLIHVLNTLARTHQLMGKYRESLPLLERARTLADASDLKYVRARVERASVLDALGQTYQALNRRPDARAAYRAALKELDSILETHPDRTDATYLAGRVGVNLCSLTTPREDGPDVALGLATAAESRFATLAKQFPGHVLYRFDLGIARNAVGNGEMQASRYDRAETAFRGAIEAYESVLKDSPMLTRARESLGGTYCNLGIVLRVKRDLPASLEILARAQTTLRPLLGGTGSATAKRFARNACWNRARTLSVRAQSESDPARSETVAESLAQLRECETIDPGSLKEFLSLLNAHADFGPLRDDVRGRAFLAEIRPE
jgi:tetratricopeptide (TPR) repeat protein